MVGSRLSTVVLVLALVALAVTTPTAAGQTLQWDRLWGGAYWDEAYGVAVSPDGKYAYVAGCTASFGAGGDAFLAKYSSTGSKVGDRLWGGTGLDVAFGVAVSPVGNYACIAGRTESFGAGGDAFLARYAA